MNRKTWTKEDIEIIRREYPNIKTEILAERMGRSKSSVYGMANTIGVKKSEEFMKSPESGGFQKGSKSGVSYRFPKGHKSWNTGMKGYCAPGSEKGHFKKGSKPHNTKFDGCISLRNDKSGRQYYWIRIENGKWIMLHVWMWQKYIGEIPEGYIVVFKNKNSIQCELTNLELISRAEHVVRNQNRSKASVSLKKYHQEGPSDKQIAGWLGYGSPELKEEILKHPDLIAIKREQLKLKRLINNGSKNKIGKHEG